MPISTIPTSTINERTVCNRCRRPQSVCFCAHLPLLTTRLRVIFLQHPRERRVAISTCRMAHLALAGSELHHGVHFDDHPQLQSLAALQTSQSNELHAGVAVLFPGEGAIDPTTLSPGQLHTLVVVDGTWTQARKLIARNPLLASLPRLGLAPSRPSNYRIRREPAEHCVSTIEAVVEVLGLLEGEPDRFRSALAAFDHMVDTQIACEQASTGAPRRKRKRARIPRPPAIPSELQACQSRMVMLAAEANAGRGVEGALCPPELLQLIACRPSTGERFQALIRPRRPLGAHVPLQIELSRDHLEAGSPLPEALSRFDQFLRADDVLCGWGRFAHELWLAESGDANRAFIDLRPIAARALRSKTGGVENAATALGGVFESWAEGRGGRRIAALESVFRSLVGEGEV